MLWNERYSNAMNDNSAFDSLMHEVCVEHGWCGGVVDGQPKHVTDFLPESGPVCADDFVDWLFLAEGVDPNEDKQKWQPHIIELRNMFIRHMGAEKVNVVKLD